MLEQIGISEKKLESYKGIVTDALLEEIYQLRKDLRGARLCHISPAPFGGGISETLFAIVPLERDSGLLVDWYALRGNDKFFSIAKAIFNGLQGGAVEINESEKATYLQNNREIARQLAYGSYDVIIVHTHSLLALPHYASGGKTRWVWRCHPDTSSPNPSVWEFLSPFVAEYHSAIFTIEAYKPSDLKLPLVKVITPAIDPLSPKNRELPLAECENFVSELGIDPKSPIMLHVSRLDHWKDPLGLIRCYYLAKDNVPELQLVIISSLALDDPETFATLRLVDNEATRDEDIHVYTNMDGFGDLEVNAFQRVCSVSLQKSLREGFGLAVSETLWKKKPVLGSRVGGIPLQLADKLDYCLVNSVEECAEKLIRLLRDKEYAQELGEFGHDYVRQHFLSPRLLRDELAFIKSILSYSPKSV